MNRPEWPTEYKRAKRWQQGPKVSVILPWKPIQIIDALASAGVTLEGSIKKCDISHRSAAPETPRLKAIAGR